jgi:hypothetical protein
LKCGWPAASNDNYVFGGEEEGQHVVDLIEEVDISKLRLLHTQVVGEWLVLAKESESKKALLEQSHCWLISAQSHGQ